MKKLFFSIAFLLLITNVYGQISAKLMRHMDVVNDKIAFVYGGDIWLVSKNGGTAYQITNSPGEESWPRFSPDGKLIAFTANYNGNEDVYVMPTAGGVPTRITYQSYSDRMIDWHPGGKSLLFASSRQEGARRLHELFSVSPNGGFAEKLKVPYAELAVYSPDGSKLAYITKITENYPFKRYRGGLTSDIIVFDLKNNSAENITNNRAIDGKPSWVGNKIYYLSDQSENMRLNIWVYDIDTRKSEQLTDFNDFDISYMSAKENDLVFESGGILYLMDLTTYNYKPVDVFVISDLKNEMPRVEDVSEHIGNITAGPEGKRIVFEARGELFNVPQLDGFSYNMTRSSGAFERNPAWSPNGKYVAYWSDLSGEYEIYLQNVVDRSEPEKLTERNKGYGYDLYWSPDGKKISFIDETNTIYILDIQSKEIFEAGNTVWNIGHPGREGFPINWSPDSKWITFVSGMENANSALFLFDVENKKLHQVTSGYFEDKYPVFSKDGKYLFYLTDREISAAYSDLDDGTWIYPNATKIASIPLSSEIPSLLKPENDEVKPEEQKAKKDNKEKDEHDEKKEQEETKIDIENFEARLALLPVKAGNIWGLFPFEGKLVYLRYPNTGSNENSPSLMYYDFEKREEETIIADIRNVVVTADGKSLLVESKGKYGVIKPEKGQKIEKPVPIDGLVMDLVPREEWNQIFLDTWRRYRDFFYDPNMHGVNWDSLRVRYGNLIKDARTRWDITNLQSNLQAELSAGHTYTFGGDVERVQSRENGYLGIDWELVNNLYKIKRIVKPAVWDTEVRSPFDQSGIDVNEGDYILSVNGMPLDPGKDPYAAFEGLQGKTVSLVISKTGTNADREEVIVKCLTENEETRLRNLEWIENNRKMVDSLSGGRLGYVYMSNTSSRGQKELVTMYYGQLAKEGFIIDERFNGGGQLADRFMELLLRPVVYNLHWRHGKDHTHPMKTNTGPMGMLINGWAGSGGDGLPWAFQELDAGPVVGERTLGVLVGPATGHRLIDGGGITVPGARLYDNDGHWFWEGEGVAPDIEVWDDPNLLVKGRDPQIEKVVEEVMKMLENNPIKMTPAPPLEDRTAEGLRKNNDE